MPCEREQTSEREREREREEQWQPFFNGKKPTDGSKGHSITDLSQARFHGSDSAEASIASSTRPAAASELVDSAMVGGVGI